VSIGGRRRNLCALGVRGGLCLVTMADDAADRFSAVHAVRDADESSPMLLTIKNVADAARLPQPVVAQLVSRVWTRDGWMYTKAALPLTQRKSGTWLLWLFSDQVGVAEPAADDAETSTLGRAGGGAPDRRDRHLRPGFQEAHRPSAWVGGIDAARIRSSARTSTTTPRPSAIRDMSRCRHAYRVDWFRRRQRQNSLSCSARALPWL